MTEITVAFSTLGFTVEARCGGGPPGLVHYPVCPAARCGNRAPRLPPWSLVRPDPRQLPGRPGARRQCRSCSHAAVFRRGAGRGGSTGQLRCGAILNLPAAPWRAARGVWVGVGGVGRARGRGGASPRQVRGKSAASSASAPAREPR